MIYKHIRRIVVPRPATNLTVDIEIGQVDIEIGQRSRSQYGTNRKGLSQWSFIPNINAVSLKLQQIWARLKFLWQTEGQTDRRMSFNVPRFRGRRGTIIDQLSFNYTLHIIPTPDNQPYKRKAANGYVRHVHIDEAYQYFIIWVKEDCQESSA